MSYTATGIVHDVLPAEQLSPSFRRRALILELPDDKYPQLIEFEFTQARCDILDAYTPGDSVTVHFDLRGRAWESPEKGRMYFTSLSGWKIEKLADAPASGPHQEPEGKAGNEGPIVLGIIEDLPF